MSSVCLKKARSGKDSESKSWEKLGMLRAFLLDYYVHI